MQFLRSYFIELILMGVLLAAVLFFGYLGYGLLSPQLAAQTFSGEAAFVAVEEQFAFGPRTTGSEASVAASDWITQTLRDQQWRVIVQPYDVTLPQAVVSENITDTLTTSLSSLTTLRARNIVAVRSPSNLADDVTAPVALVVAPYDSRLMADGDQTLAPSPGANVGGSGTATLLELAATLDLELSGHTVCLVFLDSEANRGLPGWQPPYGGHLFIQEIEDNDDDLAECADPRVVVVLEAVGGDNHRILYDPASNASVSNAIWQTAAALEFDEQFVPSIGQPMPGPHNTFVEAGYPTAALIEQGYPYRYTSEDTLDKIAPESLYGVGHTLEVWLESGAPIQ